MYKDELFDFIEDEYYDGYDERAYDYPTYHEKNHHLPNRLEDTDV